MQHDTQSRHPIAEENKVLLYHILPAGWCTSAYLKHGYGFTQGTIWFTSDFQEK
jgi:hypothetical protein